MVYTFLLDLCGRKELHHGDRMDRSCHCLGLGVILPQWKYGGDVGKAPEPFDSQVKVVPREMVMATYTYYGYADIAVHAEKLKKLMAAVEEMVEKDDFKWKIAEPTHFEGNGFSGPWTPWSMRKNEVAIQLVPKQ